ncbi:uncharacterized protein BDZ99DRAFT_473541 [Mytilinidion resinicola]|uniref:Uncharacterized protein n=1 Tax=Mytilinidion resinicola TaxID=574789 RepID=A0A6A6Z188_9PEZI|nr:uncharacterized protein BDZ99DRAFT_473541 [Mytilinidion resinicola]KAF2814489.1 hypothetical protein BDZ99DRAFT_473541 [Mytilinidion resinicola]
MPVPIYTSNGPPGFSGPPSFNPQIAPAPGRAPNTLNPHLHPAPHGFPPEMGSPTPLQTPFPTQSHDYRAPMYSSHYPSPYRHPDPFNPTLARQQQLRPEPAHQQPQAQPQLQPLEGYGPPLSGLGPRSSRAAEIGRNLGWPIQGSPGGAWGFR